MKNIAPIDVVITWVDGNDPKHQEKIRPYLNTAIRKRNDIAGPTRFNAEKEIFYCVASILRFAPFVRQIFIVTDEQDPGLDEFVRKNFPDNTIPIEIIDHKVIFRGYEDYLPTFNSLSIEALFHRIPGLSEQYVSFCDDFLLLKEIRPEDWFKNGKAIIHSQWRCDFFQRVTHFINPKAKKQQKVRSKDSVKNSARLLGMKNRSLKLTHTPHTQLKSVLENYYEEYPATLLQQIRHKFRDRTQYNTQALCSLLALKQKKGIVRKEEELYIEPVNESSDYVKEKIFLFQKKQPRWGCIQSLDLAIEKDKEMIYNWLNTLLRLQS